MKSTKAPLLSTNGTPIIDHAATLTLEQIQQYFSFPLHEACVKLNVDQVALNRRCRALGIKRWPYRRRAEGFENDVMEFTIKTDSPATPTGINSPGALSATATNMFHTFRLDSHVPATPKSLAMSKKRGPQPILPGASPMTPNTPTTPTITTPSGQHFSQTGYQFAYTQQYPSPTTYSEQPLNDDQPRTPIIIPAPTKKLPKLAINTSKKRPRNNGLSIEMMGADDDMVESPVKRMYTLQEEAETGRETCDESPKENENKSSLTIVTNLVPPNLQDPMAVSPASPTAVNVGNKSAFRKRAI
jgi:hypothetical protein